MDLNQILQDLFTFNSRDEALAFVLLLVLTFFLGILLWSLFFHIPQRSRLRREKRSLEKRVKELEFVQEDLTELNRKQGDKIRLIEPALDEAREKLGDSLEQQEVLQTRNRELNMDNLRKNTRIAALEEEVGQFNQQYKVLQNDLAEARKGAEAAKQKASEASTKAEALKGIVEEVEAEKQRLEQRVQGDEFRQKELMQQVQEQLRSQERLRTELQGALQALEQSEDRQADLRQALELRQNRLAQLEQERLGLEKRLNEQADVLYQIQRQYNQTKHQLEHYALEADLRLEQAAAFEARLGRQLELVANNPLRGIWLGEIPEHELIEDGDKVQEALAQEVLETGEEEGLQLVLEWEAGEWDKMEAYLDWAKASLRRPGFFQDIEASGLLLREVEDLNFASEAERFEHIADQAKAWVQRSVLFQDLEAEALLEDEAAWEANLAEVIPLEVWDIEAVEARAWDEGASLAVERLDASWELAQQALLQAGLYAETLPNEAFIEAQGAEAVEALSIDTQKYPTELERAVVAELGRSLPRASEFQRDDLRQIQGIGPFIERRLNHLGIYTFEQIAAFRADFIPKITAAIGFAEDAIYRDQWLEQAKDLLNRRRAQLLGEDLSDNRV